MKKILSNWALLLVIAITAAPALAATTADNSMSQGMMMQKRQMTNAGQSSSGMMDKGMMGKGMMGRGMMGRGMMGKGMMGKGMMPMMMNGCRMNSMMMGGGMMPMMGNPSQTADYLKNYKKFQKFFNETRNLRKKLNDLQFEYGEASWNPNTTLGELQRMRVRLNKLRQKIYAKRPQ